MIRISIVASILCLLTLHVASGQQPVRVPAAVPVLVDVNDQRGAAAAVRGPGDSAAVGVVVATSARSVRTDTVCGAVAIDTLVRPSPITLIRRDELPGPFDWLTNLPGDWARWGTQTFTYHNLPLMGGIALATAGAVATDQQVLQPFTKEYARSESFRKFSDLAVNIGDGKYQFGLGLAFGAFGLIMRDTTAIRTASQITEVILACGGVVQFLKHVTGRESPFVATTPTGRWALFPNQAEYAKHVPHYDAFPSGHLATALATLTVIAENYPHEEWIRWVGYPALGALSVGLMSTGIHWYSDYPLAIALGYSFGKLISGHGRAEVAGAAKTDSSGGTMGSVLKFSPRIGFLTDGTPAAQLSWVW